MSKYLEFKEIAFKGKTKRFEVVSKNSIETCSNCKGDGYNIQHHTDGYTKPIKCEECKGLCIRQIILGRIQWYAQWRQYTFSPSCPTIWNRDCMNDIIFFINNLMKDRKIIMKEKS